MRPGVWLDLSQAIGRESMRTDGLVPCLGTGCGRILNTNSCTFLTSKACLALQGHDVRDVDLSGFPAELCYRVAGNSMSVPVVGRLLLAVFLLLEAQ